ncbi:MAG: arsenate reductase ArsC [Bryobacterales bacterium]|nr:arsenate reductase ArsC [Bryobacterales bacterium]
MSRLKPKHPHHHPPAASAAAATPVALNPVAEPIFETKPISKKSVLFVCIGNSCRSQMAEGFARHYGSDVIDPASAGLSPISLIAPLTQKVMKDRGIDLSSHYPKGIADAPGHPWDLIVNMSGTPFPSTALGAVQTWNVKDPYTLSESVFAEVANDIERRVQDLIISLRRT